MLLRRISEKEIGRFAACLREEERSAATIEKYRREVMRFSAWLEGREAFGYFDGETMAGYAAIAPWHTRGEHSYAHILGEDPQNTYDFHDVLVRPAYRGRGIHTMFLSLFAEMARALDGRAIYATVDPGNSASWHNFEKAGYVCVRVQPAYDGRMRRYYRLGLWL